MYPPSHHLKIVNRHSKIPVLDFHNRYILKNLVSFKKNESKSTRGVLKVNKSYDEEYLGIILKIRLFSVIQKEFFKYMYFAFSSGVTNWWLNGRKHLQRCFLWPIQYFQKIEFVTGRTYTLCFNHITPYCHTPAI